MSPSGCGGTPEIHQQWTPYAEVGREFTNRLPAMTAAGVPSIQIP